MGELTLRLVDASRPTMANGSYEGATDRTVLTNVWYPATSGSPASPARAAEVAPGSYPVVLFSHGFMSSHTDHAGLGKYIASHGYVFVATRAPLAHLLAPGGATVLDVPEQVADLWFVLDTLTTGSDPEASMLAPTLRDQPVVVAGMSLGGFVTLLAGFHPEWSDPRVDAVIGLAPSSCYLPERAMVDATIPTMIIHGTSDILLPFELNAQPVFDALDGDAWLVSLQEGTHTGFPDATAGLLGDLEHADEVGCSALGGNLPSEDEAGTEDIFGADEVFLTDSCPLPCEDGGPTTRGMRPLRQVELTKVAMRTFLDGVVRGEEEGLAILERGLPAKAADVDVVKR